MRNMLAHYIITINDLARMLKYRVLDRDRRHLRGGTRLGHRLGTPELALAWAQGLLHWAHYWAAYDQSHLFMLGHSNKMLCFWLSGFFNSDADGQVIIIIIMGGCGLRD